ncbi:MAG: GldG family protein [candidate division WOR-3 bacterium]
MKRERLFLIAGILAFLNLILLNIFFRNFVYRVDITQNRIYTLHSVTKEVLRELKDFVNIEIYMSSKLPPEMNPYKQDLFDLLEEYRNYSNGLLRYTVFYPDKDPNIQSKARRLGIPEITFNVVEKDQVKVVNGNFGLLIFYKDKKETIPVLTETENLEYDLTSKILKMKEGDNLRTVGLLFLGLKQENYNIIRRELEKLYRVRNVSLISKIPEDINLLLIFGIKKLLPKELFYLDQFILRGGKAVFFLQPVDINYENFVTKPMFEKDLEFLRNYGISLKPNLVKDPTIPFIPMMSEGRALLVPYYYFVKILPKNIKHQFARNLEQLVLTWPSAIDTLSNENKAFKYTYIFTSTKNAYRKEGGFSIHPFAQEPPPPKEELKKYLFSLMVSSKFKSVFLNDTSLFKNWTDFKNEDTTGFIKESKEENKIVFVGNAIFLQDNFVQMYPDNGIFLMNIVNAFALGKDISEIKAREISERPIKNLNNLQKFLFQNGITFGIPLIVFIFGIVRSSIRRIKKKKFSEIKKEEKND